jgi:hypothetical protein
MEAVMLKRRRRFNQVESLQDRLATWANSLREQADKLPDGPERDALFEKLHRADTASRIAAWANSLDRAALIEPRSHAPEEAADRMP